MDEAATSSTFHIREVLRSMNRLSLSSINQIEKISTMQALANKIFLKLGYLQEKGFKNKHSSKYTIQPETEKNISQMVEIFGKILVMAEDNTNDAKMNHFEEYFQNILTGTNGLMNMAMEYSIFVEKMSIVLESRRSQYLNSDTDEDYNRVY